MTDSFIVQFREDTGEEYSDYTDIELAKAFHAKYEQENGITVDFDQFSTEFGIPKVEEPKATELEHFQSPVQYEHTATGDQPVSAQKLDLGQETIESPKLDIDQESSDMSLRGANAFLGTPEFDADQLRETVYSDSTLDAVTKAYNNIDEDFIQQYYGLQMSSIEPKAEQLLTISDEKRQRELERQGGGSGLSFVSDAALQPLESRQAAAAGLIQEAERLYGKIEESEKGREPLFVEPGSVAYYASAGVSSLANTLPAVITGVFAGPQVSLLLFYEQAKGKAYLDGRDADLSPEMANDYSTYTGLTEAIPELLPLHMILRPGVNFFKRIATGSVAEVIQEEVTETLQIGLDKGYINEDMTWAEARSRLVDAGVLAAVIGPTQAAIAHPLVKAKEAVTNGPIALAHELNKDIEATDLTVDDEQIIARMDPNQVSPENSAQAHIIELSQENTYLDEQIREFEEKNAVIDGDRRHDAGRAATGDRRKDVEQRVKVADMTPEQMQGALLTSKFGIKNERAYEEAEPLPVQVFVDADSLKWFNDNLGEEYGDEMLQKVAIALDKVSDNVYHVSGDEYILQANTEEEAHELLAKAKENLQKENIVAKKGDETITAKGLNITYGLGETRETSYAAMKEFKAEKEKAGKRAARGEEPTGVTREKAEVEQEDKSQEKKFLLGEKYADWSKSDFENLAWQEIRDDIVETAEPGQVKRIQKYAKKLLEIGNSNEEVIKKVNSKFGLSIKPGLGVNKLKILGEINDKKAEGQQDTQGDVAKTAKIEPIMPETVSIGPMSTKTTPIGKQGETLYRETNVFDLGDLLLTAKRGGVETKFFTDDEAIAIAQGKGGAIVEFDADHVSGVEHRKPGAGVIGGKEYRSNFIARNAIRKITVKSSEKMNRGLTRQLLKEFNKEELSNGDIVYTRKDALKPNQKLDIDQAAIEAATSKENNLPEPTDAQKEAGNYKKAHVTVQGLPITIENPAGSKRNPKWPVMKQHYGYIKGTEGADSESSKPHLVEQVDVFVKPGTEIADDNPVFIVDQYIDGKFDEHKVMIGFANEAEATDAYNANYTKDWDGLGSITEMPIDEFKEWLQGDTTKPLAKKPTTKEAPIGAKSVEKKPVKRPIYSKQVQSLLKKTKAGASIEYGKQYLKDKKQVIDVVAIKDGIQSEIKIIRGSDGWGLHRSDGKAVVNSHNIDYSVGYTKAGAKKVLEHLIDKSNGVDKNGDLTFSGDPRDALRGIEQAPTDRWVEFPKTNKAPSWTKVGIKGKNTGNGWFKAWYQPAGTITSGEKVQLWTNGHVMVLGKNEQLEKKITNVDAVRGESFADGNRSEQVTKILKGATTARTTIKPIMLYQGDLIRDDVEMVAFDHPYDETHPLIINADYVRLHRNLYPNATFKVNPDEIGASTVIYVFDGNTLVGNVMSMRPDGRAFDEFPAQRLKTAAKNLGANDPTKPRKSGGGSVKMSGKVDSWSPGAQYGSFINDQYDPATFTTEFNRDPTRREEVLQKFAKGVGTRLYQGRVKGKATLGFFRPGVDEVRIKNMNDLEVAAHEIAHFLDDKIWNGFGRRRGQKETRPWLHGPGAREMAKELKGVSYDQSKVYEGFAEFVRHWMTRPAVVKKAAPKFFAYWENFIKTHEYGPALLAAQQDITGWFDQRAIERATSKIGDSGIVINDAMDGVADRGRQAVFDDLHALLMMETQLTGVKTATSGGPYETARLMRSAHSIVDGALRYGPPRIIDAGQWAFTGRDGEPSTYYVKGSNKTKLETNPDYKRWGLRDVLAPVNHQLDEWTLYATGRAAAELMGQGREHLFKKDEIEAMLDMGRDRPHFKEVFDDYQKWNGAILDFAEQTGILGKEQRKNFRRTQYIPFYRVSQGAGVTKKVSVEGHVKAVHMLTGGTNNLNDILGNMVQNASSLIVEGVKNHARREAVKFANRHTGGKDGIGGGQFLTHISKDTKEVQITKDQVIDKFMKAAFGMTYGQYKKMSQMGGGNPQIDAMIDDVELNMDEFVKMYMYGQPPQGSDIIAVMNEGKPEFYQVADPMLMRSFESFNRKHPGIIRQWLGAIKRIGQSSITLTADFMAANIWRDTIHGYVISKHGFVPVIDSLKGIRSRMTEDEVYRDAIANGAGFSSYLVDPDAFEANLSQFYEKRGIDFKTVLHTPRKMLLGLEMVADAFEMSTRLGEFSRSIEKGETPRTAAYSAREVSVDFAMRGDSEALNVMYDTVLFLKAGMNGIDRIYRGFTKDPNKGAIMAKSAGIAAASVVLYTLNRGNPCYDDLEDWDKDTHWHAFIPNEGDGGDCNGKYTHLRFPKIWEIGALASGAERTMEIYLDNVEKGYADGKAYAKDLQRIFMELFKMEYLPQAVAPIAEVYWLNKNRFSQRQIENEGMKDLLPFARYTPYTNRTLVEIAELTADLPPELQFSPNKAEALIRGYLNTWGMYGLFMSDEMLMGDKLPAWRTDQYPVLRRFTRSHPMRHTKYEREFWDLVREAGMYAKTGKKMIKDQKVDLAESFIEQDPAPLFDMLNDIKKGSKEINDAMVMIYNDPELTPDQKRDQRMELQAEKNMLFKEVIIDINKSRRKQ